MVTSDVVLLRNELVKAYAIIEENDGEKIRAVEVINTKWKRAMEVNNERWEAKYKRALARAEEFEKRWEAKLERALAKNDEKWRAEMEALKKQFAEGTFKAPVLSDENSQEKKKLAYYESENQPSSSNSMLTKKRNDFREIVGSYLDGDDGKDVGSPITPPNKDGKKGGKPKKIGPPKGHKGHSHKLKPTEKRLYFVDKCEQCGSKHVIRLRSMGKLFCEFNLTQVEVSFIVAQRISCSQCRWITTAANPSIPGTILGPVLLSMILEYAGEHNVDTSIAKFLRNLHGLQYSPNGVRNARMAITEILAIAIPAIEEHMSKAPYVIRDETKVKCNGKDWYAWLGVTPDAVHAVVTNTRAGIVLDIHFPKIRKIPSVTDLYSGYNSLETRQADWIHMLRRAEKYAVEGAGQDYNLYMRLLDMYNDIKNYDTADEKTIGQLKSEVQQIAERYGEGHEVHTYMFNALPKLFTYLRVGNGMPANSNAVEQEIQAVIAPAKRKRRQIKNEKGARFLGVQASIKGTCRKQKIDPAMVFLHLACNPGWNFLKDEWFLIDYETGTIDPSKHPKLALSKWFPPRPPPEQRCGAATAAA